MKITYKIPIVVYLILTIILFFSFSEPYAGTVEEELKAHIESSCEAWSNKDIDKIISMGWAGGFGFRRRAPRPLKEFSPEYIRTILKTWFNTIEHYKVTPEEINIVIDGSDIGLAYGFHIEEVKHKGQPPEKIRVRFSSTFRKGKDGKWRELIGHRDIQRFQENGQYIRVYQD